MASKTNTGKIQTVLGLVSPGEIGVTLTHEHLHLSTKALSLNYTREKFTEYTNANVQIDKLWWIHQFPYSNLANLEQHEEKDAVIEEMHFFKENGGGTVVENTTMGIKRNINFLKTVAENTGVNIVAGTGYYVEPSRPGTESLTVEQMADHMKTELTHGCEGTDIKCGIIGEIGCSWPLMKSEANAIRASGVVEESLGCPVIIHPGRNHEAPGEIVRIYQEAGGSMNKLVMAHLDRTFQTEDQLFGFASKGCFLEYDLFGIENSYYQKNEKVDMPSDAQRIMFIKKLIENGYEDKIVIAHDMHTKHRMMKFGGHGYSHILLNIVPRMLLRGISQESIDKILKTNPARWLTYN